MNRFKATFVKEVLLLSRDRAGLAMLFVMPVFLVLVMTLLQDSTFKQLEEKSLSVLIINHDADTFGLSIVEGLDESDLFDVVLENGLSKAQLVEKVERGDFLVGIVINKNSTRRIENSIKRKIQSQFPQEEVGALFEMDDNAKETAKIEVFFDPVLKSSYKQSILGALKQYSAMVEAKLMFEIYSGLFDDLLEIELKPSEGFADLVIFDEQYASGERNKIIPNSVQHNVPAWTIFAMFFIVIPLASNIIKERNSGVSARLRTIPGSGFEVVMGKAMTYFLVGFVQAVLMLLIGLWLLPVLGLPALQIGGHALALFAVTVAIILAATSYGIVIGTLAKSEQQSSIFGSISVVILAAIGGIWVPGFMMSDLMIKVSKLSPLNWGLDAYYGIFLRSSGIVELLPNIALLLGFAVICIVVSAIGLNRKNN